MKIYFIAFLSIIASYKSVCSQDRMEILKDSVLNEGYRLYHLERASWLTTDLIREYCSYKMNRVKGYLSYPVDGHFKCIFWTVKDTLITFSVLFDSTFEISQAVMDTNVSFPSNFEKQLVGIREAAINDLLNDTTKFYLTYKNTSLNFIPLIEGDSRKVIIMTGANVAGFIPFGNDYVLWFDESGNLIKREKLHFSLVATELTPKTGEPNKVVIATMHSHKLFDIITSTDICNLLLYQDEASWIQHHIISDSFVTIWSTQTSSFIVITIDQYKKMGK